MQTSQRTGKTGFAIKIAFGILSFVVAFILIFAASVLFRQFENEILRFPASIALSFSAIAYSFVVTVFLDKNGKIKARFQAGPVNLRWFVFVGVAVAPGLLIAIIYLPFTAINWSDVTNTDFSNGSNIAFLVYAASFLLLWPASVFSYFGIKNLLPSQRLHKIKFPAFSVLNVLFLSGLIFLAATLLESGDLPGRVIDGYNHDDGPWVTWHADPTTSATVSWLTRARSGTRILIGTSPGSITQEMTGTGNVFMHHVILTSLEPGTTYYYTVPDVTFEEDHYSTTFSFTTAPSIARPFSFVVFGDKQPSSSATMLKYNGVVVDGIINASVDFAMQVGDVASSGGDIGDWHLTLLSLARLSANTPTMIAIGNHDYSGGGNLNFQDMFPYPYVNKLLAKHYSFEYLNAHFTVVDTNNLAQEQVAWVEADLASANASASVDWTFVFFHHTIISSGTCNTEWELQKTLAPIFDKYAVTAVFYGHDHHYEHSNYTYGTDGLVHDASHAWEHHPVNYFCTGGGGGNLETHGYGLTSRSPDNFTRTWYNITTGTLQDITYFRNPWNSSRYIDNTAVPGMITAPDGKNYYQAPETELYQEDLLHYGYDYGENAYHYMRVDITGSTCVISTRYADGTILSGPSGMHMQNFAFSL